MEKERWATSHGLYHVEDSAKSWGMVGQRKMSCAETGKGNMSKVSLAVG